MTGSRVLVGVATFQRPAMLVDLLDSLAAQECDHHFDVVVVDNDPEGSAENYVSEYIKGSSLSIHYRQERRPGIAAARNSILDFSTSYDTLLLIDDDETADPQWVVRSIEGLHATGATMVHGDVRYIYPQGTPRWITEGGFFIALTLPRESELPFAATNNLAIDLVSMRRLGDFSFDDQLGLAGGSDLLFTGTVRAAGGVIRWWPDALVTEVVPASRANRRWVVTRAIRSGESQANSDLLRTKPTAQMRFRLLGYAASRIVGGVALMALGIVSSSPRRRGSGLRHVLRGWGFLRAILGYRVEEYKRSAGQ